MTARRLKPIKATTRMLRTPVPFHSWANEIERRNAVLATIGEALAAVAIALMTGLVLNGQPTGSYATVSLATTAIVMGISSIGIAMTPTRRESILRIAMGQLHWGLTYSAMLVGGVFLLGLLIGGSADTTSWVATQQRYISVALGGVSLMRVFKITGEVHGEVKQGGRTLKFSSFWKIFVLQGGKNSDWGVSFSDRGVVEEQEEAKRKSKPQNGLDFI